MNIVHEQIVNPNPWFHGQNAAAGCACSQAFAILFSPQTCRTKLFANSCNVQITTSRGTALWHRCWDHHKCFSELHTTRSNKASSEDTWISCLSNGILLEEGCLFVYIIILRLELVGLAEQLYVAEVVMWTCGRRWVLNFARFGMRKRPCLCWEWNLYNWWGCRIKLCVLQDLWEKLYADDAKQVLKCSFACGTINYVIITYSEQG